MREPSRDLNAIEILGILAKMRVKAETKQFVGSPRLVANKDGLARRGNTGSKLSLIALRRSFYSSLNRPLAGWARAYSNNRSLLVMLILRSAVFCAI
jgi:hypothetical protein